MEHRYQRMLYNQAVEQGLENVLLQCTEEVGELTQAMTKYQRIVKGDKACRVDIQHTEQMIAEEIADVEICIEKVKYLMDSLHELYFIELIKEQKIERTERLLEQ